MTTVLVPLAQGCEELEAVTIIDLLARAEVDVITIGQYLRPTPKHASVVRYVEPSEFDAYKEVGLRLGFTYVASGPLVRSSYRAAEAFMHGLLTAQDGRARSFPRQDVPPHQQTQFDRYGRRPDDRRHLPLA